MSQPQLKSIDQTSVYSGPIFDADTHFYETDEAWTKYMPASAAEKYGLAFKKGEDGSFAMYVGPRKVEISADHLREDGKVPQPGKLHDWLRAMKEGKGEIDMHVEMTPDMIEPASRKEGIAKI